MAEVIRKSGLEAIPDVTWGTHLCQFYKTKEDIIDVLVPYFKAGLDNNEFCMWGTSEPLGVEDAKRAFKRVTRNLDDYIKKGQIEIFDYGEWYTKSGKFDSDEVLQGWVEKEKLALGRGFGGLRLAGNAYWVEPKEWSAFARYEAAVDDVICSHRMLALCQYSLDKCGASEITDVVGNHTFVLLKKQDEWQVTGNTGRLKAEEKFLKYFNENPKPMVIIELAEGRYTNVNASFVRFTGYSREDVIGLKSTDISWLQSDTRVKLQETVCDRGGVYDLEIGFRTKSGETRSALFAAETITIGGQPNLLCAMNDITEYKRAGELGIRADKLESIGTLAGGLAHDFNNILTAILGNVTLAKVYSEKDSELYEVLVEAEDASLRAKGLTQQLLTFARGGAPIKKIVSIAGMLRDTATFALSGSNARCQFSIPDDLWNVEIDEGQISQAIHNIVLNAQQVMPQGGTIQLRAENVSPKARQEPLLKGRRCVKISIEDHGTGIPEEHLGKIFDPYFSTKQRGSGFGLATSYSIIKNHRGLIIVESKLGVGTTFHIYLPAAKGRIAAKKVQKEKHFVGKGRILIMDDEEIVLHVGGRMLKHIGYDEVEFAKDGAEAIKLYKKARKSGNPFDVVIMDLTIPGGLGGKQTIKKLLEIDPEVKAIVSSGYTDDPIMSKFKKYGFSGVVSKPYTIEELGKVLHDLIG